MNKRSFRSKLTLLLICLLFLFSFAACTDKGDGSGDQPIVDPNENTVKEFTVAVYNGLTVTIDKYKENTSLTVEAESVDGKVFVCWNRNNETYTFDKELTYEVKKDSVFKAIYSVASNVILDAGTGRLSTSDVGKVVKSDDYSELVRPELYIGGTPEIYGVFAAGKSLTANVMPLDGGCRTYGYKWQRSDTVNGRYVDIPGATSNTYLLTAEDGATYIRVAVTGTGRYVGTVYSSTEGAPMVRSAAAVSSATELFPSDKVGMERVVYNMKLDVVEGYPFILPVPQCEHKTFVGWFDGETKITDASGRSLSNASGNYSLVARYEENGTVVVTTYAFVDGARDLASKQVKSYYIEEGSVYLTAGAINDRECIGWEIRAEYYPITGKPADWDDFYGRYYILGEDGYAPNTSAEWQEGKTYGYKMPGGKTVAAKPSDWETDYNKYYKVSFVANDSAFRYDVYRFAEEYVLLTKKPSDWDAAYATYYVRGENGYELNPLAAWDEDGFYYDKKYRILNVLPSDWESGYERYFNAVFEQNDDSEWSDRAVYIDLRAGDANNPSFMTVLLTGKTKDYAAEYDAVYREAYRITVSGGTGTGYYDTKENISLSAVVTAGKVFEKWAIEQTDGTTYYPAKQDGKLCLAYTNEDHLDKVRILKEDGTSEERDLYEGNTQSDFDGNKYYFIRTWVLTESKPSGWDAEYDRYYVKNGSVFEKNEVQGEWESNKYYYAVFARMVEKPDDWDAEYDRYFVTTVQFLNTQDSFNLSDLQKLGVTVEGGCKVISIVEQIGYVLRYELNLNVGSNRISVSDPSAKAALNAIYFFDNDDGVFVFEQVLHYNEPITWLTLPAINHYGFNGWQTVDGTPRENAMPRLERGEKYVVVGTFSAEKYLITVQSGEHGMGRIGSTTGAESGYYSYGDTIRIYVTADEGYKLDKWVYGENLEMVEPIIVKRNEDRTGGNIIYYYDYFITGEATDDDKTVRCVFTEREYRIVYKINLVYDNEDVTGEDGFIGNTVVYKNGLTYTLEATDTRYYVMYSTSEIGNITVAKLDEALRYYGYTYRYVGPRLNENGESVIDGAYIDLGSLSETRLFIKRAERYCLPVVKIGDPDTEENRRYILYTPYLGVDEITYLDEESPTYRNGLLGKTAYAMTAATDALYKSEQAIFDAPTPLEFGMRYASDTASYWKMNNWLASYGPANQNKNSFSMPKNDITVTGTYEIDYKELSVAGSGDGGKEIVILSVNGRDPAYYATQQADVKSVPYGSEVKVAFKVYKGYEYTETYYTIGDNNISAAATKECAPADRYSYEITFAFESGRNSIYYLDTKFIDFDLGVYLRVDYENEETTEYLLGQKGLQIDRTKTRVIDGVTYYYFKEINDAHYQDLIGSKRPAVLPDLIGSCHYSLSDWGYLFMEEDENYEYRTSTDGYDAATAGGLMPDDDLLAFATLNVDTYSVTVEKGSFLYGGGEKEYEGTYMSAGSSVKMGEKYPYYAPVETSYILPKGYHFTSWSINDESLRAGSFFRNEYKPYLDNHGDPLNTEPDDFAENYNKSYYLKNVVTGIYELNASPSWKSGQQYYYAETYECLDFPQERFERGDLFRFYSYSLATGNTPPVWKNERDIFFAKEDYIELLSRPDDWANKYGEFYVSEGTDYVRNASPLWDENKTYYYVGLVRLTAKPSDWNGSYKNYYEVRYSWRNGNQQPYQYIMTDNDYEVMGGATGPYFLLPNKDASWNLSRTYENGSGEVVADRPADWESDYASYYYRVQLPSWYYVGDVVTVSELKLYVQRDVRIKAEFALNGFTADIITNGSTGLLQRAVTVTSEIESNTDLVNFRYGEKLNMTISNSNINSGNQGGWRIEGIYIYAAQGNFSEQAYSGRTPLEAMTEENGRLFFDTDTYNYTLTSLNTEMLTESVVIFIKYVEVKYKITYVLYTGLNEFKDETNGSDRYWDDPTAITLTLPENASEELTNKFRISFNATYKANMDQFLTREEVESLLTADQRKNKMVFNWLDADPSIDSVRAGYVSKVNDNSTGATAKIFLTDYKHTNANGNITFYGLMIDLFRFKDGAIGFNSYLNNFPELYAANVDELVVPMEYEGEDVTALGLVDNIANKTYTFKNNAKIEKIVCSENIERIIGDAFSGCVNLRYLTLSSSVTNIGENAFMDCSSLVGAPCEDDPIPAGYLYGLTFYDTLRSIGRNAFRGTALETVTLNNVRRTYGYGAFSQIEALKEIVYDCVTTTDNGAALGEELFSCIPEGENFVSALTMTVGEHATRVEALFGTAGGRYLKTLRFAATGSNVEIAGGAFRGTSLETITIPTRVNAIGTNAFAGSTLTSVEYASASTIDVIASGTFSTCARLTQVILPRELVTIGSDAFSGTPALTAVYYDNNNNGVCTLTTIGANAFGPALTGGASSATSGLKIFNLKSTQSNADNFVNIPSSVKTIGNNAFAETAMETLKINGVNVSFGQKVFYNSQRLTSVEYNVEGNSVVTEADARIFDYGTNTVSVNCDVVVTDNVTFVPQELFKGMRKARSLTVGKKVATVQKQAFANMGGLGNVYYNAEKILTSMDADTLLFGSSGNRAKVTFGEDVTEIGDYLFNAASIAEFDLTALENKALVVKKYAFKGASATAIAFPKMTKLTLNENALSDMGYLTDLTVDVRTSELVLYKNAFNWQAQFVNIELPGIKCEDQSFYLNVSAGYISITYVPDHYTYTVPNGSVLRTVKKTTNFSVDRGDDLQVAGTLDLGTDLYVDGTLQASGVVTKNSYGIFGGVFDMTDLTTKDADATAYSDLILRDDIALGASYTLRSKRYILEEGKTLTVPAGYTLDVDATFDVSGEIDVSGGIALVKDLRNENRKTVSVLNGDIVLRPGASLVVDTQRAGSSVEKNYFGEMISIETGVVIVTSTTEDIANGLHFLLQGTAKTLEGSEFEASDVLYLASGSVLTVDHDIVGNLVDVQDGGRIVVNTSAKVSTAAHVELVEKKTAYYSLPALYTSPSEIVFEQTNDISFMKKKEKNSSSVVGFGVSEYNAFRDLDQLLEPLSYRCYQCVSDNNVLSELSRFDQVTIGGSTYYAVPVTLTNGNDIAGHIAVRPNIISGRVEANVISLYPDNVIVYYKDLPVATNRAAEGDTLKLLCDQTASGVVIQRGLTIELSGHKLTLNNAISVEKDPDNEDASYTVTVNGTGEICGNDTLLDISKGGVILQNVECTSSTKIADVDENCDISTYDCSLTSTGALMTVEGTATFNNSTLRGRTGVVYDGDIGAITFVDTSVTAEEECLWVKKGQAIIKTINKAVTWESTSTENAAIKTSGTTKSLNITGTSRYPVTVLGVHAGIFHGVGKLGLGYVTVRSQMERSRDVSDLRAALVLAEYAVGVEVKFGAKTYLINRGIDHDAILHYNNTSMKISTDFNTKTNVIGDVTELVRKDVSEDNLYNSGVDVSTKKPYPVHAKQEFVSGGIEYIHYTYFRTIDKAFSRSYTKNTSAVRNVELTYAERHMESRTIRPDDWDVNWMEYFTEKDGGYVLNEDADWHDGNMYYAAVYNEYSGGEWDVEWSNLYILNAREETTDLYTASPLTIVKDTTVPVGCILNVLDVSADKADLELSADLTVQGTVVFENATLALEKNARNIHVNVTTGGKMIINGGTQNLGENTTYDISGEITLKKGSVSFGSGQLNLKEGSVLNVGGMNMETWETASFTIQSGNVLISGDVNNYGTFKIAGEVTQTITVASTSTITNYGTFESYSEKVVLAGGLVSYGLTSFRSLTVEETGEISMPVVNSYKKAVEFDGEPEDWGRNKHVIYYTKEIRYTNSVAGDAWEENTYYTQEFVRCYEKPDDWASTFSNYWIKNGDTYEQNWSDRWDDNEYYSLNYSLVSGPMPEDFGSEEALDSAKYLKRNEGFFLNETIDDWQENTFYKLQLDERSTNDGWNYEEYFVRNDSYVLVTGRQAGTYYRISYSEKTSVVRDMNEELWNKTYRHYYVYDSSAKKYTRNSSKARGGKSFYTLNAQVVDPRYVNSLTDQELRNQHFYFLEEGEYVRLTEQENWASGIYYKVFDEIVTAKPSDWDEIKSSCYVKLPTGAYQLNDPSAEWDHEKKYALFTSLSRKPGDWNEYYKNYYVQLNGSSEYVPNFSSEFNPTLTLNKEIEIEGTVDVAYMTVASTASVTFKSGSKPTVEFADVQGVLLVATAASDIKIDRILMETGGFFISTEDTTVNRNVSNDPEDFIPLEEHPSDWGLNSADYYKKEGYSFIPVYNMGVWNEAWKHVDGVPEDWGHYGRQKYYYTRYRVQGFPWVDEWEYTPLEDWDYISVSQPDSVLRWGGQVDYSVYYTLENGEYIPLDGWKYTCITDAQIPDDWGTGDGYQKYFKIDGGEYVRLNGWETYEPYKYYTCDWGDYYKANDPSTGDYYEAAYYFYKKPMRKLEQVRINVGGEYVEGVAYHHYDCNSFVNGAYTTATEEARCMTSGIRGYTYSTYSVRYENSSYLQDPLTFADSKIVHWNLSKQYKDHKWIVESQYKDQQERPIYTDYGNKVHDVVCEWCGSVHPTTPTVEHRSSAIDILSRPISISVTSASQPVTTQTEARSFIGNFCLDCDDERIFVYECRHDTTVGDINAYLLGHNVSLFADDPCMVTTDGTVWIYDILSSMETTDTFNGMDGRTYYLMPIKTKQNETVYLLTFYEFSYDVSDDNDSYKNENYHRKNWTNNAETEEAVGYYYEKHTYNITGSIPVLPDVGYYTESNGNYVAAQGEYNSSVTYYVPSEAVRTTSFYIEQYSAVVGVTPTWRSRTYYSYNNNRYSVTNSKPADWDNIYYNETDDKCYNGSTTNKYYTRSGSYNNYTYTQVTAIAPTWQANTYYDGSHVLTTSQPADWDDIHYDETAGIFCNNYFTRSVRQATNADTGPYYTDTSCNTEVSKSGYYYLSGGVFVPLGTGDWDAETDYYTFSQAVMPCAIQGACSVCNSPTIMYFDDQTTVADFNGFFEGTGYVAIGNAADKFADRVNNGTIPKTTIGSTEYYLIPVMIEGQETVYYVLGVMRDRHKYCRDWDPNLVYGEHGRIVSAPCRYCSAYNGQHVDAEVYDYNPPYTFMDVNYKRDGKHETAHMFMMKCHWNDCNLFYLAKVKIEEVPEDGVFRIGLPYSNLFKVDVAEGTVINAQFIAGLTKYELEEDCYLLPIKGDGNESGNNGYILVQMTHAMKRIYQDVNYHQEVCSVCGEKGEIKKHVYASNDVGYVEIDGRNVWGRYCLHCHTNVPYTVMTDHTEKLGALAQRIRVTFNFGDTIDDDSHFYDYLDNTDPADIITVTMDIWKTEDDNIVTDRAGNPVILRKLFYLVPTTGGYVYVHYDRNVHGQNISYAPSGDLSIMEGRATTYHTVTCTEIGCTNPYHLEKHTLSDEVYVVNSDTLGRQMLVKRCIYCGQEVAVSFLFDDKDTYDTLDDLLEPLGFAYYSPTDGALEDSVSKGQFLGKNVEDYAPSIDVNKDGRGDYFAVPVAPRGENGVIYRATLAGYVLIKFNHHMKAAEKENNTKEYHTMICEHCGYTYTTLHSDIEPYGIIVGNDKFNYDNAGAVDPIYVVDKNFLTYNDKVLTYYFGPETTVDDLSQYFVMMNGFRMNFKKEDAGVLYGFSEMIGYIAGKYFPNGGPILSLLLASEFSDKKDMARIFVDGKTAYWISLRSHDQSKSFQKIIFDGYKNVFKGGNISSNGNAEYHLLAFFDENAPKEGYFRYYNEETKVEIASYKDVLNAVMWRGEVLGADRLTDSTATISGSQYVQIDVGGDEKPAVFHFTDDTTLEQVTQYLIGNNGWEMKMTAHYSYASVEPTYAYAIKNDNLYYSFDVTASGYVASETSIADSRLVKSVAETVAIGGETYYRIPLYSHSVSTLTWDKDGKFYVDGSTYKLSNVSAAPVAYLLAKKDGTYSYGSFTEKDGVSTSDFYVIAAKKNESGDWDDDAVYYEKRKTAVKVLAKPENWSSAYGSYFVDVFTGLDASTEWAAGRYYAYDAENDKFLLLTAEPDDWNDAYFNYYYAAQYTKNSSEYWAVNKYYQKSGNTYVLLTEKPTGWDTEYDGYYYVERYVPNTSSAWVKGKYFDVRDGYFRIDEKPADWEYLYPTYYKKVYVKAIGEDGVITGPFYEWVSLDPEESHPDYRLEKSYLTMENGLFVERYYRKVGGSYEEVDVSEYCIYKNGKLVLMTEDDWRSGLTLYKMSDMPSYQVKYRASTYIRSSNISVSPLTTTDFYLTTVLNRDAGRLILNVDFDTTLDDLDKLLRPYGYTYYHDGMGLDDSQSVRKTSVFDLLANYLKDNYYRAFSCNGALTGSVFFLPLARIKEPGVWVKSVVLDFDNGRALAGQEMIQDRMTGTLEDRNVFFLGSECEDCGQGGIYYSIKIEDNSVTFEDLKKYVDLVALYDEMGVSEGADFGKADWEDLYYRAGVKNTDPIKLIKEEGIFDTMAYGATILNTVYLLCLGTMRYAIPKWEEGMYYYFEYQRLTEKPLNWAKKFNTYYYSEDEMYVLNQSAEWVPDKEYYVLAPVVTTEKPENWKGTYYTYYTMVPGHYRQNENRVWKENEYYNCSFSMLTELPDDFETSYKNYYMKRFDMNDYVKCQNIHDMFSIFEDMPADWETNYSSYFMKINDDTYVQCMTDDWDTGASYYHLTAYRMDSNELLETKPDRWFDEYASYYVEVEDQYFQVKRELEGLRNVYLILEIPQENQ